MAPQELSTGAISGYTAAIVPEPDSQSATATLDVISEARCVFPQTLAQQPGSQAAAPCAGQQFCVPVTPATRSSPLQFWVRQAINAARTTGDAAAAILAPGVCAVCSLPLTRVTAAPVCAECLSSLKPASGRHCYLCAATLGPEPSYGLAETALRCNDCHTEEPPWRRAVAFGHYSGVMRRLIHVHKFDRVPWLARPLGAGLAQAIGSLHTEVPGPVTLVAVPLHRGRRPFNQSELLAAALRQLRRTHPDWAVVAEHRLLRRTRRTASQANLTRGQRRENVRGAFATGVTVAGRTVLLIDDVLTTGATASECTRVLLRAGAAAVYVATVARAGRDFTGHWDGAVHDRTEALPAQTASWSH